MKKAKCKPTDEMRPEYRRSDFGELVRGKYAARISASTNVVLLDPKVARAFPNDRAVNDALRSLLRAPKKVARPAGRTGRPARKRAAA